MYKRLKRCVRGSTLVTTLIMSGLATITGIAYLEIATRDVRTAAARMNELVTHNLAEAGVQAVMQDIWRQFKIAQRFSALQSLLEGASPSNPRWVRTSTITGVGNYQAFVISYEPVDSYRRRLTVRSVGWIDYNNNGMLDANEPRRVVDQSFELSLSRSEVFNYAYFVNNYGWMYGFSGEQLVMNGDSRSNGDFELRYGSGGPPVFNGSIIASPNEKLSPRAQGRIILPYGHRVPRQWSNAEYAARQLLDPFMRPAYNSLVHGVFESSTFRLWRDYLYHADAQMVGGSPFGAVLADVDGTRNFHNQTLDSRPTSELVLPNLNDLNFYIELSRTWRNPRATFSDGTPNPNYNQPARIEVWDPQKGRYVRLDTNGVINGSVALIGYKDRPIRIHGPITVTQDVVIRGYVEGQGTIYAGRNVHIVGDIIYKNPPDFRGNALNTVLSHNERKDALGLAARGSIIMGNTRRFGYYPLYFMTPPFTRGRYDENGNWIPPFDARQVDSTGRMRYQSAYGDPEQNEIERLSLQIDIDQNGVIDADERGISRIDAIMFTNFVGGGNLATDGRGLTINGAIIAKDEAMVLYSLPLRFNYDWRIRERSLDDEPLINIQLPRVSEIVRLVWQSPNRSF
ncbi:MAG: hypothetical protein NZ550_04240 [Fimbriimonadales bacterium]|nr:hypothetical protein [Fimbriimonadales bacterium]MDW8051283.1 hypothetical protein [Armatimonadota bacterium]